MSLRHAVARAFTRRRGCSGAPPASPPPTSARRTSRSRRFSTAWSGTSACRRSTSPDVLEKFDATFESYWASPEFEDYDPAAPGQLTRFDRRSAPERHDALTRRSRSSTCSRGRTRREILEKLDVERKRHHRWKNLVVAATGTGKTIVAALDYKRLRARRTFGPTRACCSSRTGKEILDAEPRRLPPGAARRPLRRALRRRRSSRAVAARLRLGPVPRADGPRRLRPDAFDVVIVDEFHHAAAPTYERLLGTCSRRDCSA